MTPSEKIEASNVWDRRFGLPTIPIHDNPWIYIAYTFALVRMVGNVPGTWAEALARHVDACKTPDGVITRWPHGGRLSHDELMGAAYLNHDSAKSIIAKLEEQDGLYGPGQDESDYMFRFVFLKPFLRACAGYRVGIFSQIVFSVSLLLHAFTYKPDVTGDSGTLKNWLMGLELESHGICALTVPLWRKKIEKKGVTLKRIFSKTYLTECPVLAEIAPEHM